MTGKMNNVMSILETTPPITTVASGRCTSAPTPLLKAIGKKPTLATADVIRIVRKQLSEASVTAA